MMKPEHAQLMQQAATLHRQGQQRAAIEVYQRLLAAYPQLPDCWYDLAFLLKAQAQPDAALAAYAQALAYGVTEPQEVHLNRAVIYTDLLRRDAEAEAELKLALTLAPTYVPALLNLGNLHEERGQRQEALHCYQQILNAVPEAGSHRQQALRAEALARMANLTPPTTAADPLLVQLQRAAAVPAAALSELSRANVLFALGRAYDTLGLYDAAFAAFRSANQNAARGGRAYDRGRAEQYTAALLHAFPGTAPADPPQCSGRLELPGPRFAFAAAPSSAAGMAEPVFICGMFRSGSTLLEQALAAHPQIQPGGELEFFPRLVRGILAPFPTTISRLDQHHFAELAQDYRVWLQQLFPDAVANKRFITDKRPDNYLLIGLIKQLFPSARFLHTVRDPRDIGLSIYMHHLDQEVLSYSSQLTDIGHHIGEYQRLMQYWKHHYGDSIHDFDYDQFVRDPRSTLQAVLDFLGLDWSADCLQFHLLRNSVKTASYWQVRRPLYADASGRWRLYRSHLGELLRSLQSAGVPLPAA